jgi:hypothetical protein
VALLFFGAPSAVTIVSGFLVSIALAFRRPLITMRIRRLIFDVVVRAFVSWFSWEPKQTWVDSPGMFWDRLPSRFRRITQTSACFMSVQICFVPPIILWGGGQWLTPEWLWGSALGFFTNLLLPVFLFLCVLLATGARPLWIHLAAIEWTEKSNELEDF